MKHAFAAYGKTWAILPEYRHLIAGLFHRPEAEIEAEVRQMALSAAAPRQKAATKPGVAVVPVHGILEHRPGLFSALGFGTATSSLRATIAALGANPEVDAIVLDIDSPGGEVEGITEAAATIRDVRSRKPVIASANTMAASAAYWLGSQATELVAAPSATVGSIGVYGAYEDVSGLLEQEGIKVELISAGRYKTEASGLGPLTDEARAYRQSVVDGHYAMFVEDVAAGRGTTVEVVESEYGEGRMLLAERAKAAGMVDRVETLDVTVGRIVGALQDRSRVTAAMPDTLVDGWTSPPPEWAASTSNWMTTTTTGAAPAPAPEPDPEPVVEPVDPEAERLAAELEFRRRRAARVR